MGKNLLRRLYESDLRQYPTLVGLMASYLHQDADLLSGSFENALSELIDAASEEKSKIYAELNDLICSVESEEDAKAFFYRHSHWLIEGSHKQWFQSLVERIRAAERKKHLGCQARTKRRFNAN